MHERRIENRIQTKHSLQQDYWTTSLSLGDGFRPLEGEMMDQRQFKNATLALGLVIALSSATASAFSQPDWNKTPGVLCSAQDANFSHYDYPEHIARCDRNVNKQEKQQIAEEYGNIPESDWPKYEFDHLIPLCAGGSDDIGNLWPQPIDEAHQKDGLENSICIAMKAGTMTQAEAVQKVHDWFAAKAKSVEAP